MAFISTAAAIVRSDKHMDMAILVAAASAHHTLVVVITVATGLIIPVCGIKRAAGCVRSARIRQYDAIAVCIRRLITYRAQIIVRRIATGAYGIIRRILYRARSVSVQYRQIRDRSVSIDHKIAGCTIIEGACEAAVTERVERIPEHMALLSSAAAIVRPNIHTIIAACIAGASALCTLVVIITVAAGLIVPVRRIKYAGIGCMLPVRTYHICSGAERHEFDQQYQYKRDRSQSLSKRNFH